LQTDVYFSGPGDYTYEICVSDGNCERCDQVTVTVLSNVCPIITAFNIVPFGPIQLPSGGGSVSFDVEVAYLDPDSTTSQITATYDLITAIPVVFQFVSRIGSSKFTNVVTVNQPGQYQFEVTISDGVCSDTQLSPVITVLPPPNQCPTLTLPPDRTLGSLVSSTTLTGTYTDPDNGPGPLSFQWSQVSGPSSTIVSPTSLSTNILFLSFGAAAVPGVYEYELCAYDGECQVCDNIKLTIPNLCPTINNFSLFSGSYTLQQQSPGQIMTTEIDITYTDQNVEQQISAVINLISPIPAFSQNIIIPQRFGTTGFMYSIFRFNQPGQYQFELVINDGFCSVTRLFPIITVLPPPNQCPQVQISIDAENTCVDANTPTAIDFDLFVADETPLQDLDIEWQILSGPPSSVTVLPGGGLQLVTNQAGNYQVRVIVSDGECTTTLDSEIVTIYEIPTLTVGQDQAVIIPSNGSVTVDLDASSTNASSFQWYQLSGPVQVTIQNSSNTNASVQISVPGIYVFEVFASNGECAASNFLEVIAV
jgi:hypothetical protein